MRKGTIYKITNGINGKVYIGATINHLTERLKGHFYTAKNHEGEGRALYDDINLHGEDNFTIEELVSANENELRDLETFYIDKYNAVKEGYNIKTAGGYKYYLSKEDEQDILNYCQHSKAKCSVTEIHNRTGIPKKYIHHVLDNNGVKRRKHADMKIIAEVVMLYQDDVKVSYIARDLNLHRTTVYSILRKAGVVEYKPFENMDEEMLEHIITLSRDGKTYDEIKDIVGIGRETIGQIIRINNERY